MVISNIIQTDLRKSMNIEHNQCIYCRKTIEESDGTFEDVVFGLTGMCEECFDTMKINNKK